MKHLSLVKPLILFAILVSGSPALAGQLVSASLKNGDYGTGPAGPGTAVPPTTGVVNTADGVLFVATETGGRSNGLVNWQIGNNFQWRRTGTITFMFKAIRGQFGSGFILGDNYGFGTFHNGQGTFSVATGPVANGPGPEDDRVRVAWNTWHNNVWYTHAAVELEYDRWYSLGFAWGGPSEFEIWVDQELKSAVNIAASFPWGSDGLQSGFNMGLGDNHERGVDGYNSAPGVMFADVRMWDQYRALGDTVSPNRPPVTTADGYDVDEDGALTVAAPGVLGNDSDPDGDALTATLVTPAAHGTLAFSADGSFSYAPFTDFHGADGFTYEVSDGSVTATASVTIAVAPVNDPPVTSDLSVNTTAGTPITVTLTATDIDSAAVTFTAGPATGGTVTGTSPTFTFTPAAGFAGTGGFSFVVDDGDGGSASGLVHVAVAPPADPFGALADAINGLSGLNHGQRTSLLARLANAERAYGRGQHDVAARMLEQVADSLARFSSSADAGAVVAALRALAASLG